MVRYQYDRPDLDLLGPEEAPVQAAPEPETAEEPVSRPRRAPVVRMLLLLAALTGMAMLGGTAARYWKEWSAKGSLFTAGNFYFASDELDGSLHRLTEDAKGWAEFSFTLQNYIVENYPTESDISYTCTVKDGEETVTGVRWQDQGTAGDLFTGTLSKGADRREKLTCFIPAAAFRENGEEKELTVIVEATQPYTATLRAKVTLAAGNSEVALVITDRGRESGAVSVALYNTSGKVKTGTLKWPSEGLELVPDPTWETLPDAGEDPTLLTGNSVELTIPADGVICVVFLKKDIAKTYNGDTRFQFVVSGSG